MPTEEATESLSISVPPDLATWLRRRADDRGVDVETYGRELLVAQQAVDTGALGDEAALVEPVARADLDDAVQDAVDDAVQDIVDDAVQGAVDDALGEVVDDSLDDALDDGLETVVEDTLTAVLDERLDAQLEDVRDEFTELLEDVRGRVIQVKREADAKAPAEHEHPELVGDLDALDEAVASLVSDVDEHRTALDELREDVDGGFRNFESVLEHLLETTDQLVERADRLGRATIATRERVRELATAVTERERVDELKRDAALEAITTADCEACDRSIRLSLLTAPRCPACAADFVDLQPKQGFLGSPTLVTGDHPALASGDLDAVTDEIESAIDADRPHPGDVDWESTGDDS